MVASDNEIFYTYGFIALAKKLHAMHFLCWQLLRAHLTCSACFLLYIGLYDFILPLCVICWQTLVSLHRSIATLWHRAVHKKPSASLRKGGMTCLCSTWSIHLLSGRRSLCVHGRIHHTPVSWGRVERKQQSPRRSPKCKMHERAHTECILNIWFRPGCAMNISPLGCMCTERCNFASLFRSALLHIYIWESVCTLIKCEMQRTDSGFATANFYITRVHPCMQRRCRECSGMWG